jgi:hypothetical protein
LAWFTIDNPCLIGIGQIGSNRNSAFALFFNQVRTKQIKWLILVSRQ